MNEVDKRSQEVKSSIEFILARKGTVYTLGLLMGILCRLSRVDYNIAQELEYRAENLDKH